MPRPLKRGILIGASTVILLINMLFRIFIKQTLFNFFHELKKMTFHKYWQITIGHQRGSLYEGSNLSTNI